MFDSTSKKQQRNNSRDVRCLKESDFYPPSDDRDWKSYVYDIVGGDNFADYCEEFFELLDEENYYDN